MTPEPSPDPIDLEDQALVERCLPSAAPPPWPEFFARFDSLIRTWIRRRMRDASPADREDVYQDVALKILRGGVLLRFDRQKATFRAFLYTVVNHVIIDRHRDLERSPLEPLPEPSFSSELSQLADTADPRSYEQLRAELEQYLVKAGYSTRDLRVVLALLDNRRPAAIALEENLSEARISQIRARFREDCRKLLGLL